MIEWITPTRTAVQILPSGTKVGDDRIGHQVGYRQRPGVIGLAVLEDGHGAVVEGTPEQLRGLLERALVALNAHL